MAKLLGATDFINPSDQVRLVQEAIVDLTDGGVDYSFECIGNVKTMRAALECCHKGWVNRLSSAWRRPGKKSALDRFQLVTGRVWRGRRLGESKAAHSCPVMSRDT